MSADWPRILEFYREFDRQTPDRSILPALRGLENLVAHIIDKRADQGINGWTSVLDLCIQQGNHRPYSVPYLRISSRPSGQLEFRYLDTGIEARQWHRLEAPERAIDRFEGFLSQLRWVAAAP